MRVRTQGDAMRRLMGGAIFLGLVAAMASAGAQGPPPGAGAPAPQTGQTLAPLDMTGTWVSVITEEWRWRMMTPPKGDALSIPVTAEARKVADTWDPAKDTADGNACRAYSAIGVMRLPGRLRVAWQDENTLRMETDAGQQTRLFRFGGQTARPAGEPSGGPAGGPSGGPGWQGTSVARWQAPGGGDLLRPGVRAGVAAGGGPNFGAAGGVGPLGRGGSLLVETTNLKAGYLRKNGIPHSENARLIERFFVHAAPDGNRWLTVVQTVQDPLYLNGDYVTSWHFKREPDDTKFRSAPCNAS